MTKEQEKLLNKLSPSERYILDSMKTFPKLDKQSQMRLRKTINNLRRTNPAFDEAFGHSLSSIAGGSKSASKSSVLEAIKDVVTHPVRAVAGEVGRKLIQNRNKAPEILTKPHPVLDGVAESVDFATTPRKDLEEIARKLGAALRGTDYGDKLGIAAPQIGIAMRIFVCQGAFCINPSFTPPKVGDMKEIIEACYSVPGKKFRTKRHKYGWARWTTIDGKNVEYKLKGKDAIVFQHELNHLDGLCCSDIGEEIVEEKKPE